MLDILQEIELFQNQLVFTLGDYETLTIAKSKLPKNLIKVKNFVELLLIDIWQMWQM